MGVAVPAAVARPDDLGVHRTKNPLAKELGLKGEAVRSCRLAARPRERKAVIGDGRNTEASVSHECACVRDLTPVKTSEALPTAARALARTWENPFKGGIDG